MPDLPTPREGFEWLSKNRTIGYFDKSPQVVDKMIQSWEAYPEDENSYRVERVGRNVYVELPKPENPLANKVNELVNKLEELTKEKQRIENEKEAINNELLTKSTALVKRQELEKQLDFMRKRNEQLENSWFGGKLQKLFGKKPTD